MIYDKPRAELFAQDAPESEIKPFTAWLRGLGIAFEETNGYPELESFNGLLQALNSYIKYLEQNGFAEWSADLEYPIGAGVRVGNVWYKAKRQNTNKPPSTSQSDWSVFLNAGDLSYADPLQNVDGQIRIKDASTTQKGVVRRATSSEVGNRQNVNAFVSPSDVPYSLGVGQTTSAQTRSIGTTYINNTGKPIQVYVCIDHTERVESIAYVGSVMVSKFRQNVDSATGYQQSTHSFIVPNNSTYRVTGGTLVFWTELR